MNRNRAASTRSRNWRRGSRDPEHRTGDAAQGAEFLDEALARGHEGIMAKATDATYAAGARGQSWLKVKQARTLDLVILAAEWGTAGGKAG